MGRSPSFGPARLIVGIPEQSSDLYYKTGFLAPDPVILLEHNEKTTLIVSSLEFSRAKQTARVSEVLSLENLRKDLQTTGTPIPLPELLNRFLEQKGAEFLIVPRDFPALFYERLLKRGWRLEIQEEEPFFRERLQKTPQEVAWIQQAIETTQSALQIVVEVLGKARVEGDRVIYAGEALTSERLKGLIDGYLFEKGMLARHTIVASGPMSALPHEEGKGAILAGTPIVIDIFPMNLKTRYYADITRTFVKGKPTERLEKMYHAVREAQAMAFEHMKAGASASSVHRAVLDHFERSGFPTKLDSDPPSGFIHTTGHGLGLDIHEPPRIGNEDIPLLEGSVLTVEPGLYDPEIGGVRIEDDVLIEKEGVKILSSFPKEPWILP